DALSGVASCRGTVASGSRADTGSVGAKAFTVTASDRAGNTLSKTISYVLTYRICPLYDEQKAHHAPSTVPVKLQLCDYGRSNVSSSSICVIARRVAYPATGASTPPADACHSHPG